MVQELMDRGYRSARKVVVAVVGGTIVLAGIAMLVLPGPAIVVIPLGLGVLALEFAWARRWLRQFKAKSQKALHDFRNAESR